MEIVHADPTEAPELRDLHLTTWALTYRDRASESWYRERLANSTCASVGETGLEPATPGPPD
jgi:hypothetical protein